MEQTVGQRIESITMTELQQSTLKVIEAHSKGDEITGKEVAMKIGLRPRDTGKEGADMRSVIHALRVKGYLICANTKGYFYATDINEAQETIESLEGRVKKQYEAIYGMRQGIELLVASNNKEVIEI